jgi:hypothetical protein
VRAKQKSDEGPGDSVKQALLIAAWAISGIVIAHISMHGEDDALNRLEARSQQCSTMLSDESMKYQSTEHYLDTHYVDASGRWHPLNGKQL